MQQLIIGNKNYSSWSLRAWLLLAHHGIEFREIRIPLDQPDTKRRLADYTGAGKVPVWQDGDLTVWDSLAICETVSEQWLGGRGWPENASARAEARSVTAEMHSGFAALREQLPMNCRAHGRRVPMTPELERDIARIDRVWSNCRARWQQGGPWLFGSLSIADCFYAPVALRCRTYGVELSEPASAYRDTLLGWPALKRWVDDACEETETIPHEEVGQVDQDPS